jgi:hypothetical protein
MDRSTETIHVVEVMVLDEIFVSGLHRCCLDFGCLLLWRAFEYAVLTDLRKLKKRVYSGWTLIESNLRDSTRQNHP